MSKPPITDSAWFWFALFPAVGLMMLLATGGKFGKRQAGIERQGQARSALAEAKLSVVEQGSGRKTAEGVPEYSQPGETQVGLGPLSIMLGTISLVSFGLLIREQLFAASAEQTIVATKEVRA